MRKKQFNYFLFKNEFLIESSQEPKTNNRSSYQFNWNLGNLPEAKCKHFSVFLKFQLEETEGEKYNLTIQEPDGYLINIKKTPIQEGLSSSNIIFLRVTYNSDKKDFKQLNANFIENITKYGYTLIKNEDNKYDVSVDNGKYTIQVFEKKRKNLKDYIEREDSICDS